MHIHKTKRALIKGALYTTIITCALGAATGTFAWYSYQKDVSLDFQGTTIKADKEIQIGLRSKTRLYKMVPNPDEEGDPEIQHFFDEDYTLGEIEMEQNVKLNSTATETYYIYWIRGNYVTDILKNFQSYIHCAQSELHPITAGKYKTGDVATGTAVGSWTGFKQTPSSREDQRSTMGTVTGYEDYFYLPLAFRVMNNEKDEEGNVEYLSGQKIYMTEFNATDHEYEAVKASVAGKTEEQYTEEEVRQLSADLTGALRVKCDYPSHSTKGDNFIFDPNDTEGVTNKYLPVGGALNLQPDIYYDYDLETKKQIPYGWFDSGVYYKTTASEAPTNPIAYDNCTTFTANNLKGGYEIDYSEGKTVKSTCETKPTMVDTDFETSPDNFIITTESQQNYGFLDLSIYLEGWDENVVNYTAGRTFSVELQFSIK